MTYRDHSAPQQLLDRIAALKKQRNDVSQQVAKLKKNGEDASALPTDGTILLSVTRRTIKLRR